jgi:hypothetical protein
MKQHQPQQSVGPQQTTNQLQGIAMSQQGANADAKTKADMIERRLFTFAVITFFGHVLIAFHLVSQMHIVCYNLIFF